jgi:hypothetical protein
MRIIAFVTDSVSIRRLGRFAIPLRFEGQDEPSLARPLDGTKVHRTFVFFRLALEHIGEPPDPPSINLSRGPPAWEKDVGPVALLERIAQPEPDLQLDQTLSW